jgi:hypothetical protein
MAKFLGQQREKTKYANGGGKQLRQPKAFLGHTPTADSKRWARKSLQLSHKDAPPQLPHLRAALWRECV